MACGEVFEGGAVDDTPAAPTNGLDCGGERGERTGEGAKRHASGPGKLGLGGLQFGTWGEAVGELEDEDGEAANGAGGGGRWRFRRW